MDRSRGLDLSNAALGGLLSIIIVHRLMQAGFGHLPDPALAVLFIAGFCGARVMGLALGCLAVLVPDLAPLATGGSAACLSPAYPLVVVALSVSWWFGRAVRAQAAAWQCAAVFAAGTCASVLNTTGFYWVSGVFVDPSVAGLVERLEKYGPAEVGTTLIYGLVGIGILRLAFSSTGRVLVTR